MPPLARRLWQDEHGVILSTEIVIVGSVLVVGLITGLTCLQEAVTGELKDLSGAIGSLDQSFSFEPQVGDRCHRRRCGPVWTAGSCFHDKDDSCKDRCDDDCGTIVAERCGREADCHDCASPCADPCHSVTVTSSCSSCRSSGCGGCGTRSAIGPGLAQEVCTGVPGMKMLEWPTTSTGSIVADCEHIAGSPCQECQPVLPEKASFINIPDSVW